MSASLHILWVMHRVVVWKGWNRDGIGGAKIEEIDSTTGAGEGEGEEDVAEGSIIGMGSGITGGTPIRDESLRNPRCSAPCL